MALLRTTHLSRLTPFWRRASRPLVLAACVGASGGAFAQLFANKDWQESPVPPPPAFSESRLVPIEMPPYLSLKFGVDPATIAITGDGVVRYVVVASNRAGGATNAFYEGVRCATGEMKSYAHFASGNWETNKDPDWLPMRALKSSYSLALATQALCRGGAPRETAREMMSYLKNPIREVE